MTLETLTAAARAAIEPHMTSGHSPGCVGLIGQGDASAVVVIGDLSFEGAQPMARDTLFRIASMTKPITAAAAMMLVEDGLIALDEPVDRLLPELAGRKVLTRIDALLDDTVPANRPITVEDLLSFRLGLGLVMAPPGAYPMQRAIADMGLMGFGAPDPASPLTPDEWIARLGDLPLMAQPGEQWLYTTGSNVLGVLIARAAGRSLPEVFAERVFGPLGMKDTGFWVPADKAHRLCAGYAPSEDGPKLYDAGPNGPWTRPPPFPAADAGLVSTVDDFFAFSRFLAHKGRAGDRQLLSSGSVDAMTRNHLTPAQIAGGAMILGPDMGWGYGMAVAIAPTEDGEHPGSHGWAGGFGTTWTADPVSDRTAILLTQTMFAGPQDQAIHKAFAKAVFTG